MTDERSAARRAAAVNDRVIVALYGGAIEAVAGARSLFNPWIDEPDWNRAGGIDLAGAERDVDELLAAVESFYRARQRRPAVAVDPFTRPDDLAVALGARGWSEAFRHAGLIHPPALGIDPVIWPEDSEVVEWRRPAAREGGAGWGREAATAQFADVFDAAFSEVAEGALSPGYRRAFEATAAVAPEPGVEVVYTLVRIAGEPAAVGSRVLVDGVAGLYNLGVAPPFRRLGLGGAITLHRVASARAAGAEVVYLLTEDPKVEASQRRRGFEKAFEVVGWVAPPA